MLRREEKILLYGSNLWYFGEGMLGPLFAVFTERIGGNILDISGAYATYLGVTGVLVILIGKISDRLNKEKIMAAGYALNAIFTFGYLAVSDTAHLFVIQAGLGVAAALAVPTWSALYDKYSDTKNDGLIWGLASGEAYIVTAVALLIGGFVVSVYSFTVLFVIMGTVQVVAALYQSSLLRKRVPRT